jgi:hypothetical protein
MRSIGISPNLSFDKKRLLIAKASLFAVFSSIRTFPQSQASFFFKLVVEMAQKLAVINQPSTTTMESW